MKLALFMMLLALWNSTPAAQARGGGSEGGGGGNKLIAEFVATANALLENVNFTREHREILREALDNVSITTGPGLVDLVSGEPVPGSAKLIAWGSPGRIQLKEKGVLFDESFEDAVHGSQAIAHIVIHELFRASGALDGGGKSIDESFQLSIGLYGLDRNATRGVSRVRRSLQRLYAECKVTACELRGAWGSDTALCRPADKELSGYLGATLQVFKVSSSLGADQHDGTVSILRPQAANLRLQSQELLAVRIEDGREEMQIIDDETNALLDFKIRYSTRKAAVSSGRLTMQASTRNAARFVDLTLGECHTSVD